MTSPEFSIIVCSHRSERAAGIRAHYAALFRDLALILASTGSRDAAWQQYHDRFVAKYRGRFAAGQPGKASNAHARAPRAALAQLTRPDQLLQALRWG